MTVKPEGGPSDPPGAGTVQSLDNDENEIVLRRIHEDGVEAHEGSLCYARDAGSCRAVVSSSTNCADVLAAVGREDLIEARVGGLTAERDHLAGKPAPDMFLAGARALEVTPGDAVVFEDALAGVVAGRAGGFGFIVGVDRAGQGTELKTHGADVVVGDPAGLLEAS